MNDRFTMTLTRTVEEYQREWDQQRSSMDDMTAEQLEESLNILNSIPLN